MADFTGQNIQDSYQRVVQVDDNQLQDGTGSNLPISFDGNNVTISGSLTANEYIISSSVTNIVIATLSGSTEFGNDINDTHFFQGNITASGNISASGNMSMNGILNSGATLTTHLTASGNISAIGLISTNYNISASGTVHGNTLQTDSYLVGDISQPTELSVNGKLTVATTIDAGSDITTSGLVRGSNISDLTAMSGSLLNSINAISVTTASLLSSVDYISVTTASLLSSVDHISVTTGSLLNSVESISIVTGSYAVTGSNIVFNHITASGNISSSGNITADRVYFRGEDSTSDYLSHDGTGLFYKGSAKIHGHVTASGNISASGNIIASGNISASQFALVNNVFTVGSSGITHLNNLTVGNSAHNDVHTISGKTSFIGNITASGEISTSGNIITSGDISASGYVYSANEESFGFSFLTDANSLNWFGPNRQGMNNYFWNKNYGDDDGVTEISLSGADKRFVQAGWHVPYKCVITGWELLGVGSKNNTPFAFTASLCSGDPISASIALHGDNSNDVGQKLNLTMMHSSASRHNTLNDLYGIRYINSKGAMSHSLAAGQHVYPRIKHTTLASADNKAAIQGNWTIYYRRIE